MNFTMKLPQQLPAVNSYFSDVDTFYQGVLLIVCLCAFECVTEQYNKIVAIM